MALRIPLVVSEKEKKERSARLLALSQKMTDAFYQKYIGTTSVVLLEKAHKRKAMHGFTPNYIRVEIPLADTDEALDNQLVNVRLGDFNRDHTALMASFA
jgi:threonylcarbamoyladenosine tRNA methylthiotransferase MtaB